MRLWHYNSAKRISADDTEKAGSLGAQSVTSAFTSFPKESDPDCPGPYFWGPVCQSRYQYSLLTTGSGSHGPYRSQ